MRLIIRFTTALALGMGAAASAQAPQSAAPAAASAAATAPAVGAKVFDKAGAELGAIEAIEGTNVTIAVESHRISVPLASIAKGANGLSIAITKAAVLAAAERASAPAANSTAASEPSTAASPTPTPAE